ncbi:MAG: LolA family protein [Betaproteobacteria bacterium]
MSAGLRWLGVVLGLGYVLSAGAAEFGIAELMRPLAQVPSAEARFTETRRIALLQAPLVVKGRLAYVRPDRLEKHVLEPYDERTVVSGNTVVIENRTRNRTTTVSLTSAPAILTLVESLRATLAGDAAALERHYAVRLGGRLEDWTLTLTPRAQSVIALIAQVRLSGKGARVLRVEVDEAGGDSSLLLIEGSP